MSKRFTLTSLVTERASKRRKLAGIGTRIPKIFASIPMDTWTVIFEFTSEDMQWHLADTCRYLRRFKQTCPDLHIRILNPLVTFRIRRHLDIMAKVGGTINTSKTEVLGLGHWDGISQSQINSFLLDVVPRCPVLHTVLHVNGTSGPSGTLYNLTGGGLLNCPTLKKITIASHYHSGRIQANYKSNGEIWAPWSRKCEMLLYSGSFCTQCGEIISRGPIYKVPPIAAPDIEYPDLLKSGLASRYRGRYSCMSCGRFICRSCSSNIMFPVKESWCLPPITKNSTFVICNGCVPDALETTDLGRVIWRRCQLCNRIRLTTGRCHETNDMRTERLGREEDIIEKRKKQEYLEALESITNLEARIEEMKTSLDDFLKQHSDHLVIQYLDIRESLRLLVVSHSEEVYNFGLKYPCLKDTSELSD